MNSNAYDLTGRSRHRHRVAEPAIGAATARLLARYGADVVIASRTAEELEKKTAAAVHDATGRRLRGGADRRQRGRASRTHGFSGTVDEFRGTLSTFS